MVRKEGARSRFVFFRKEAIGKKGIAASNFG